MGEGLLELNEDQLRRLAKLVRGQELQRIQTIPFGSENERVQYLRTCNANYDNAMGLLDSGRSLLDSLQSDETKYEIAHLVWELLKALVNFGIQAVRNYTVRKEFLNKVVAHADDTMGQLRRLDSTDEAAVRRLSKDAEQFKQAITNFNAKHGSLASKIFSQEIKQEGISFEQLVSRYKVKRGLYGPFKDLSQDEKFSVYEDIIKASGRGQIVEDGFAAARKELLTGFGLFTFVAAVTVWDIYLDPSTSLIERATRDVKDIAASVAGSTLGGFIRGALMDTDLALIEGASTMISVGCFVLSVGIGMVLAVVAGFILDAIFSSGGEHTPSVQDVPIYVAPMPDGEALARQIVQS